MVTANEIGTIKVDEQVYTVRRAARCFTKDRWGPTAHESCPGWRWANNEHKPFWPNHGVMFCACKECDHQFDLDEWVNTAKFKQAHAEILAYQYDGKVRGWPRRFESWAERMHKALEATMGHSDLEAAKAVCQKVLDDIEKDRAEYMTVKGYKVDG